MNIKLSSCCAAVRRVFLLLVLLLTMLPAQLAAAKPGDLDPNFLEPNPTGVGAVGHVYAGPSVAQSDGKIIVAGSFWMVNGQQYHDKIARLNSDGSLDDAFAKYLVLDYSIYTLALLPDGDILAGGSFSKVGASTPANHIIRLNSDGTRDTAFNSAINVVKTANGSPESIVNVIVPLSDGDLLVGGIFSSVGGVARGNIARLNADGSLDTAWMDGATETGANGRVMSIAVQPDGKIVIGGMFTQVNGIPRGRLARLESDGSLDNSFLYGDTKIPEGSFIYVSALALQPDGKVVVGGTFTNILQSSPAQPYLARLESDGRLDTTFRPAVELVDGGRVNSITRLSDGDLLVAGYFARVNGANRGNIVRLDANGTNDPNFMVNRSGTNGIVSRALVQIDGKILITGSFTRVHGVNRNLVARLYSNGTLDVDFLIAGANHEINAVDVQPADGKVLIGGRFYVVNGLKQTGIARLNPDGTADTEFFRNSGGGVSGGGGRINAIVAQPDGGVLVGGNFTKAGHLDANNFARFDAVGNPDSYFNTAGAKGTDGEVYGIALQPDGKIVVAGSFQNAGELARRYVARFNVDGTLDATFMPAIIDKMVYAVAVQADGKILIAGDFTTVGGQPRGRVARLNADGSLDEAYLNGVAGASSVVRTIGIDPNGNAIIGGWFTSVNDQPFNRIARLSQTDGAPDPAFLSSLTGPDNGVRTLEVMRNGTILIGGEFDVVNDVACKQVAVLTPSGALDSIFTCLGEQDINGGWVNAVTQQDNKIFIGGEFTAVLGAERGRVAVLEWLANNAYLPVLEK